MSEVFNIAFTVFTLFTGISIGVIAFLITVLIIFNCRVMVSFLNLIRNDDTLSQQGSYQRKSGENQIVFRFPCCFFGSNLDNFS